MTMNRNFATGYGGRLTHGEIFAAAHSTSYYFPMTDVFRNVAEMPKLPKQPDRAVRIVGGVILKGGKEAEIGSVHTLDAWTANDLIFRKLAEFV